MHSLFETDKAPGAVVLQVVDRLRDAADLWFAGKLPGVIAWMLVCSHVRPVLWLAGRAPGAAEGLEDCRSSDLWKWALKGTGRCRFADCLDPLIAWWSSLHCRL